MGTGARSTDRRRRRAAARLRALWPHAPIALLVLVSGAVNVVTGSLTFVPTRLHAFAQIQQFGGSLPMLGRSAQTILGAAMVLVGIGLFWRVTSAWAFALFLAILMIAVDVARHLYGISLFLPVAILVGLIVFRRAFQRRALLGNYLISLVSIIGVLAYGTFGSYLLSPGFSPPIRTLPSGLFYTITTLATVGSVYQPNRFDTQMFELSLIVVGLGIFTTVIVSAFGPAISGELERLFHPENRPMHLRDHVVVVGQGAMAQSTAAELERRAIPYRRVIDHPCDEEALRGADVGQARLVVAAVDDDSDNAMVALLAKDLNPAVEVLAVASSSQAVRRLKLAGADVAFAPIAAGSRLVASLIDGEALPPQLADLLEGAPGS